MQVVEGGGGCEESFRFDFPPPLTEGLCGLDVCCGARRREVCAMLYCVVLCCVVLSCPVGVAVRMCHYLQCRVETSSQQTVWSRISPRSPSSVHNCQLLRSDMDIMVATRHARFNCSPASSLILCRDSGLLCQKAGRNCLVCLCNAIAGPKESKAHHCDCKRASWRASFRAAPCSLRLSL